MKQVPALEKVSCSTHESIQTCSPKNSMHLPYSNIPHNFFTTRLRYRKYFYMYYNLLEIAPIVFGHQTSVEMQEMVKEPDNYKC